MMLMQKPDWITRDRMVYWAAVVVFFGFAMPMLYIGVLTHHDGLVWLGMAGFVVTIGLMVVKSWLQGT